MVQLAKVAEVIGALALAGKEFIGDKSVRSFICGTYSDGRIRNLSDAVNGEYLSPHQKKRATFENGKKKKKHKPYKFKL